MQTDDNLISLVGKPSAAKRKRTRNRQAYICMENLLQQQADNANTSVAAKIVPGASTATGSQGASQGGASSATSLGPKQPNTPGGVFDKQTTTIKSEPPKVDGETSQPQKPAAAVAKSEAPAIRNKKENSWLTPQKLLQWQQFQQNIYWNFEAGMNNQNFNKSKLSLSTNRKGKPKKFPSNYIRPSERKKKQQGNTEKGIAINKDTKSEAKMTEIKWELNKVDDLDDSTEDSPVKSQIPKVVQGLVSEIKLTVKDHRKLVTAKETPQSNAVGPSVKVKHQRLPTGHMPEYNIKIESRQDLMGRMEPPELFLNRPNYKTESRQDLMGRIEPPELFLNRPKPAGVPMTFLMQQNSFGAIQPQQNPTENFSANEVAHHQSLPTLIPVQVNYSNSGNADTSQYYTSTEIYDPHNADTSQHYSPTEMYDPHNADNEEAEGRSSPDLLPGGQKRLSAFHRLGPVSEPKKPKLTINLLCNKDVREVVDDTKKEVQHTPVHLRQDILKSTDETVVKYLPWWPWKKNVSFQKYVTARSSKSVMILEQEQMEEAYDKDGVFFEVYVQDFPAHWGKEQVLDLLLENLRGKSFIPCFVEFTPKYCKFLVIRSKSALTAIHRLGFYIRHGDAEIGITIKYTDLTLNQIDFIPRLVLRKILSKRYDSEMKLDLEAFTLQEDVSHFIYFPLNRPTNQSDLTQLQSTVAWEYLTDLNLARNRLKSIDGFNLESCCPRLRKLDLSHNHLERVTSLLRCRGLPLKSLRLEGNPLCHDYTDPDHYLRVVKMMFPALTDIDGLPIQIKGEMPKTRRHYCPEGARELVEQFLEVFFPLLDSTEERGYVEDMYAEKAVMTITYRHSARSYLYRYFRNLMVRARSLEEGEMEAVEGVSSIVKLVSKWPPVEHDPATFTSDVLHHTDLSTILRVGGILKLTSDSLAQDEHLLSFTRTFVLTSRNGVEYKIHNEMVHWDEPTSQYADIAFQINSVRPKPLSLKLDSPPDKETKEGFIDIFSKITELDKETSERCLEVKEWNLKIALEHFMKLVKLDCLDSLKKTDTHRD